MIGEVFGRLTVVAPAHVEKNGKRHWRCDCCCGRQTTVRSDHLRRGKTTSCGCYRSALTGDRARTHGGHGSRLHRIWKNMKSRCSNERIPNYRFYGERGIRVCDEWRDDFRAFEKWAIEYGYGESLSIDRINSDGPYSPQNCRWASASEQAVNRRSTHFVQLNGEECCLTEAAERLGIRYERLRVAFSKGSHQAVIDEAMEAARQRRQGSSRRAA